MAAIVNCNLDVGLRTDNAAVYICKGKVQCFNFTALKCSCEGNSGTVSISLLDPVTPHNPIDYLIVDNFGRFDMNSSGICFRPAENLGVLVAEYSLDFTATNQITDVNGVHICGTTNFSVRFVYDPCSCGKCCRCK